MRRRQKFKVKATAYFKGFDRSVDFIIGQTWANNVDQAISNLKHRLIFNPETMVFICYVAEVEE